MATTEFLNFLQEVESTEFETNTTATGAETIQQSARNELRKRGVAALLADLVALYGSERVVETKDGIVIVAENEPVGFTFSGELKSTIKSIDYDPFIEAMNYEEEQAMKAEKRAAKEQAKADKIRMLEEKRAKKLAEIERKTANK